MGKRPSQEGEADYLRPASRGQKASGRMRPGGWPLGSAAPVQWAEHSEECCQVRVEQQDQLLQQLQHPEREHVVCEEWVWAQY